MPVTSIMKIWGEIQKIASTQLLIKKPQNCNFSKQLNWLKNLNICYQNVSGTTDGDYGRSNVVNHTQSIKQPHITVTWSKREEVDLKLKDIQSQELSSKNLSGASQKEGWTYLLLLNKRHIRYPVGIQVVLHLGLEEQILVSEISRIAFSTHNQRWDPFFKETVFSTLKCYMDPVFVDDATVLLGCVGGGGH